MVCSESLTTHHSNMRQSTDFRSTATKQRRTDRYFATYYPDATAVVYRLDSVVCCDFLLRIYFKRIADHTHPSEKKVGVCELQLCHHPVSHTSLFSLSSHGVFQRAHILARR